MLKLNSTPPGFDRKLTTEMWLYPDGSRILELSTKCPPKETFQVAAEARAFLSQLGIDLSGQQQTKTKTALEQFSRHASPVKRLRTADWCSTGAGYSVSASRNRDLRRG